VKVLEGSLLETRFAWPSKTGDEGKKDGSEEECPMVETGSEKYGLNGVTYISGQWELNWINKGTINMSENRLNKFFWEIGGINRRNYS
jgi:hypothetical protein